MEPDDRYTAFTVLMQSLYSLSDTGLITISRQPNVPDDVAGMTFAVTPLLAKVQNALGVSLTQLASTDPSTRLIVDPVLDQAFTPRYRGDLFVLMPFLPELRPVYDDHLKSVADRLGMSIARADDFFTAGHVIEEVWTAVVAAKVIVADCTGRNPNVFYEIGLAHAIGKPVILITSDQEDVPFDLRHRRYIRYEFTPRGMREFEDALQKTLETIRSEYDVA